MPVLNDYHTRDKRQQDRLNDLVMQYDIHSFKVCTVDTKIPKPWALMSQQ